MLLDINLLKKTGSSLVWFNKALEKGLYKVVDDNGSSLLIEINGITVNENGTSIGYAWLRDFSNMNVTKLHPNAIPADKMDKRRVKFLISMQEKIDELESLVSSDDRDLNNIKNRFYRLAGTAFQREVLRDIHEEVIDTPVEKLATYYYNAFPEELKHTLVSDYQKMELFKRRQQIIPFCFYLYKQLEDCSSYIYHNSSATAWFESKKSEKAFGYLKKNEIIRFSNSKSIQEIVSGNKPYVESTDQVFFLISYLSVFNEVCSLSEWQDFKNSYYKAKNTRNMASHTFSDSKQSEETKQFIKSEIETVINNPVQYFLHFSGFLDRVMSSFKQYWNDLSVLNK